MSLQGHTTFCIGSQFCHWMWIFSYSFKEMGCKWRQRNLNKWHKCFHIQHEATIQVPKPFSGYGCRAAGDYLSARWETGYTGENKIYVNHMLCLLQQPDQNKGFEYVRLWTIAFHQPPLRQQFCGGCYSSTRWWPNTLHRHWIDLCCHPSVYYIR